MKVTAITAQKRNSNRVNISVDNKYSFSLDINQITDLGIKIGNEYDERGLNFLKQESQFGKIYGRTIEYCLIRPRSLREVSEYLRRKFWLMNKKNIDPKSKIDPDITKRIIDRLVE